MLLTGIRIQNLGPFYYPFEIEIDPHVTILTGGNDVGKSCLLHFIHMLLAQGTATEMDVNQDHLQEAPGKWTTDTSLTVTGEFRLDGKTEVENSNYVHSKGDTASIVRCVMKESGNTDSTLLTKEHSRVGWPIKLPKVAIAPTGD